MSAETLLDRDISRRRTREPNNLVLQSLATTIPAGAGIIAHDDLPQVVNTVFAMPYEFLLCVVGEVVLSVKRLAYPIQTMELMEDLTPYAKKRGVEGVALGVVDSARGRGIGNRLKDYPNALAAYPQAIGESTAESAARAQLQIGICQVEAKQLAQA